MKKIATALLIIIGGFAITLWFLSEPRPTGKQGIEADQLARSMLTRINANAWDSLKGVSWRFKGIHRYKWYKQEQKVDVIWDNLKVAINLQDLSGQVFKDGEVIPDSGEVQKAIGYFFNDSFWLIAPYKVFDDGTERSIVDTDEGKGLLVTYTSGGVTPGDSYLWFINEEGFPYKYKMWTSLIPVGGVAFTWENWVQLGGVWFPQSHKGIIEIEVDEIELLD